jgi:hypothetical protein
MIMKWKDKKDMCRMGTTHDDNLVSAGVRGKDIKRPKVVVDYNSQMGGVDLSSAYLVSNHSTRK